MTHRMWTTTRRLVAVSAAVLVRDFKTDETWVITRSDVMRVL